MFRRSIPKLGSVSNDLVHAYFAKAEPKRIIKNKPIDEVCFCVLDTETTGFNTHNDRILTIGAVKVKGSSIFIGQNLGLMLHQEWEASENNVAIHGLLPSNTLIGLSEEDALLAFIQFLGNDVIVGHHIGFDIEMLNQVFLRTFGYQLYNHFIDTHDLSRRLINPMNYSHSGATNFSLDKCLE